MTSSDSVSAASPARVASVDALRGFIMFWIVGGDALVGALTKAMPGGFFHFLSNQLTHSPWEGVAFYDLIFPTFIFVVGVSMVFSTGRSLTHMGRAAVVRRIIIRSLILYLLGVFLYGGMGGGWEKVRWLGVLQRIAICYLFSGLAFSFWRARGLAIGFVLLLVSYWAALTFLPLRDFNLEKQHVRAAFPEASPAELREHFQQTKSYVRGHFEEGLNLTNQLDFQYLPGRLHDGNYDPEGLLSTVPAIATCLFGVFAGLLLHHGGLSGQRKVYVLAVGGVCAIGLGYLWGWQFPVVKKIWTSSYVLVAGGYSCLMLALFHQVIEIQHWRKWAVPFLWFGMNSIAIYLVFHLVDFRKLAERIVGGPVRASLGVWADPLGAAVMMVMVVALVRELYRRKIFIKL